MIEYSDSNQGAVKLLKDKKYINTATGKVTTASTFYYEHCLGVNKSKEKTNVTVYPDKLPFIELIRRGAQLLKDDSDWLEMD